MIVAAEIAIIICIVNIIVIVLANVNGMVMLLL